MSERNLRLAELMAGFSLAMDLGLGQPLEWVMRTCLLGVRLAERLGLSTDERRQVYFLSLLRHIGCTSTASMEASVFGDELAMGRALVTDSKHPLEALRFLMTTPGRGGSPRTRARYLGKALAAGPAMKDEVDRIQCEVASMLTKRLGFDAGIQRCVGQVFERWDGRGVPNGLRGETLAVAVRVAHLAHDVITRAMLDDRAAAIEMARQRAGRLYDPAIVAVFVRSATELFASLDRDSAWDAILESEPGEPLWLSDSDFDAILPTIADFADLKAPTFAGYSRGVAALADAAAESANLPRADGIALRRAALVQEVGRVAISASIWNRPGPLSDGDWERVRLHPYYTERILDRSPAFSDVQRLAILHHERLDGSGYHRRTPASMQPKAARILAAASAYQAMIMPRPHRGALSPEAAATELRREVAAARLDGDAVDAVLSAAGHALPRSRPPGSDLSPREIEVLRLLVRGHTNREIAAELVISPKTVGHHIQHIYNKIGVSSRAAATLYAAEHHLLAP